MNEIKITLPMDAAMAKSLKAGDAVSLSGTIYVARDAAHKRFAEALSEGRALPFPIEGAAVYYMGPSPAKPGQVIGSAGPTTASRMDRYTPTLLDLGLRVMIGKGKRSGEVVDAMVRNGAVYLAAVGGAGALYSKCIKSSRVVDYEELGAEALREITVEDMKLVVAIDSAGNSVYK